MTNRYKNRKGHTIRKVNNGFVYLSSNPNRQGQIIHVSKKGNNVLVNFGYDEYIGYSKEAWFDWRQVMPDRFRDK